MTRPNRPGATANRSAGPGDEFVPPGNGIVPENTDLGAFDQRCGTLWHMNAVSSNRAIFVPPQAGGLAAVLRQPAATGVKLRPLLAVLTVFWVYVTLSNVVY